MSFTAQKLDWIERVVRDQAVSPLACRVATLIGLHYLNRTSGDAWPSQGALAADLGVSRRSIQYALDDLIAAGHLAMVGSRGRVNHYRPVFETEPMQDDVPTCDTDDAPIAAKAEPVPAQPIAHLPPLPAQPIAHLPAQNHSHMNPLKRNPLKEKNPLKHIYPPNSHLSEGRTANGSSQAGNKVPVAQNKPQAAIPVAATPNPPSSAAPTSPKKQERRPMNISVEDYSSFEIWWEVYPKRVAKFAAATAYGNVLKLGLATTDVLLAGAKRYTAERAGQEAKFTKHPATWLNGGCWMDEPQAPPDVVKPGSAYAGLRAFVEDGDHGGK